MSTLLKRILNEGTPAEKKTLFSFNSRDHEEMVLLKFNLWTRYFFPQYFTSPDAPFHKEIDVNNIRTYKGGIKYFVDIAFRGAAKRQPLDAKILTPIGFRLMGDLEVGDFVIGSDGKPVEIEFISETVDRPVYKIETRDGRTTECDSEHLWTIRKMSNVRNKHVTIDTQHMIDEGLFYERSDNRYPSKSYKEYKFALETVKAVQLERQDLPIDPYMLGVILGDGSTNNEWGTTRITCHKDDEGHYKKEFEHTELGDAYYDKRNLNVATFCIKKLGNKIVKLGLNCHGKDKFVPDQYLKGDIDQRKAILEGLMDTDGTVTQGKSYSSFCSTSERLADAVVELVRSLGGRASKSRSENNHSGYYRVSMRFSDYKPFRLKRKVDKCGLSKQTFETITNIELVGNKLGRCIKVKNEDGLYVTDDYILTHNTSRTKLFLAYAIANDTDISRKYIRVLCADFENSKQIITDIYNMLISPRMKELYADIFQKSDKKREETMKSFTTSTGIKISSGTVGQSQRGALQEEARPDLIWFEDIESRKTLRSARDTKMIWDNMEEARTGLSADGVCIYSCNYISESGNVHKLVQKKGSKRKVLIVPIVHEGVLAWPERYSHADIAQMKVDDDDFEGERMCKPSSSKDIFFSREVLDRMPILDPIKESAGFKIYKAFNPSHRYGTGHDVAGGVGLDSSTTVILDFDVFPIQVVATYNSNVVKPDVFGDEIERQAQQFGNPLVGIERNNHGHATIARAKQLGVRLYEMPRSDTKTNPGLPSEYGWNTNAATKPKMLFDIAKAIDDGLILLNDPDLIQEAKSYSRNDMMDKEEDPRLTTRHFDLLIALAIAWQTKSFAVSASSQNSYNKEVFDPHSII